MKFRRILSVILAAVIVVSCAAVTGSLVASGADRDLAVTSAYQDMLAFTSAENDYGLASTVNDGTILQAWTWSFKNIEDNLETIAQQGFTTIQVSPPNEIKEATKGKKFDDNQNGWWMFYQPAGFQLNESADNALGTKEQFVSMCTKAHELGLKIIVDTVINHMGTNGYENDDQNSDYDKNPINHVTGRALEFEPVIYNNNLFHSPYKNMQYLENGVSQYDSTYDLTRNCTSHLPDLKTEDSRVQSAIYDYMDELLTAGADGFRFDAAKHIETPDDIQGLKSDFWKNTLSKVRQAHPEKECYAYGEILNTCGVNRPYSMYFKFFEVTDNCAHRDQIMPAVKNGAGNGNATPFYNDTGNNAFTKANTVLWEESHDTYVDGTTTGLSVVQRGKIWALTAGRSGFTTVYLARPDDSTSTGVLKNISLGTANKTSWSNATTKAINQFHNYFLGQPEYCTAAENGWAYIERGATGAVIVRLGGSTSGTVNLPNHNLKNGTYKDAVTGNTFTVSGGRIKGSVGNTGVACIYFDGSTPQPTNPVNPTTVQPSVVPDPEGYPYKEGHYTVVFSNSQGWSGSINLYYWTTGEDGPVAWPGTPMDFYETNEFGQSQYIGFVPVEYGNIIINNGEQQTVDTPLSGHVGLWADTLEEDKYTVGTWDIPINIPGTPTDAPTPTYAPDPTSASEPPLPTNPFTPSEPPLPTNPLTPSEPSPTYPVTPGAILGDADSDGEVMILDATAIQRSLASLPVEKFDEAAADADEDGKIMILDATAIQRYLASLSTNPNIGKPMA